MCEILLLKLLLNIKTKLYKCFVFADTVFGVGSNQVHLEQCVQPTNGGSPPVCQTLSVPGK